MNTKKVFLKGINGDDVDHLMSPEEYLGAMNFRFTTSENGRVGYMSNIEGNIKKDSSPTGTFTLPAGNNKTIGSYEDTPNRRVYFFNYNDLGNSGIYCYDSDTDLIYTVLLSTDVCNGLGFIEDIHSIAMVDDQLFWTDNVNPPRRINVLSGIKKYHPYLFPGATAYYGDNTNCANKIPQSVITVIRNQPWCPLVVEKKYDSTYVNNFTYKEVFQFAYRFVYKDFEVSTFSPLSSLINYNLDGENYNKISVTIPLQQRIEQDVLRIEVAVKFPVGGKMFIIKTFKTGFNNHNNGTALSFDFYNDSIGIAIDDATTNKQYDVVPLRSKTLEIAKNRLFLGNNVEGYESPSTTSLTASPVTESSNYIKGDWWAIQYYPYDDPSAVSTIYLLNIQGISNSGYYRTTPNQTTSPGSGDVNFTTLTYLGPDFYPDVTGYIDETYGVSFIVSSTLDANVTITNVPSGQISNLAGKNVFKSNSTYKLGVVFYDEAGRKCGVVEGANVKTQDRTYDSVAFTTNINWTLTNGNNAVNEIPVWAKYYSIVITKCIRTSYFIQMKANELRYVVKNADGTYEIKGSTTSYSSSFYGLAVSINSLFTYGMGYTYSEGDLLKLYLPSVPNPYNLKIKGQYSNYVIVDLIDLGSLDSKQSLFEIYTPYVQSTYEYYYENGKTYTINYPGLSIREYSTITGSISGDVYLLERSLNNVNYLTENMSPNNLYWSNWNTNTGRPSIVIDKSILDKKVNIRYSNSIIPGSEVNGLCTFDTLDETQLPYEMSEINRLMLVSKIEAEGTVMLAIGKEETASIYLGENQVFDNTGSSFLAKSSGVIGNINVLRGSFGTGNPESVIRVYGSVYWFDSIKGAVVRYDVNGLFPISSNKMFKYFKKIGRDVRDYNLKVFGGFDPYNMEILMYVPRVSLNPLNETLDDQIISEDSFNNNTYYVIDIDDSIVEDGSSNLLIYNSSSGGGYSTTVNLNTGRLYKLLINNGTATYANENISNNELFFAIEDYESISITLQADGSYILYEIVRSLYETYDGQGGVWVYKPDIDRWTSVYSYIPEWFCLVSDRLISFKNGYPYLHSSGVYNQFYGKNYDSIISFLHNESYNITKVYNNFSIEGDTPSRIHVRTEIPNIQSSDALSSIYNPRTRLNGDFIIKEGVCYTDIYRDRLSPNVSGSYDDKMMKGDPIRGEIGKFQVVFLHPNTLKKLKFVNIGFTQSWGNTTINK